MATTARGSTSDLDLHSSPHPFDASEGESDATEEHDLPQTGMEEGGQVARICRVDEETDSHRQQRDHDGTDTSFGRQGVRLLAETATGVHGLGHDVQELGQVAPDLALDPDGRHHPFE